MTTLLIDVFFTRKKQHMKNKALSSVTFGLIFQPQNDISTELTLSQASMLHPYDLFHKRGTYWAVLPPGLESALEERQVELQSQSFIFNSARVSGQTNALLIASLLLLRWGRKGSQRERERAAEMSEYSLKKQGETDGRRERERGRGEKDKVEWEVKKKKKKGEKNDTGSCRKKASIPETWRFFFFFYKLGMEKYEYVI